MKISSSLYSRQNFAKSIKLKIIYFHAKRIRKSFNFLFTHKNSKQVVTITKNTRRLANFGKIICELTLRKKIKLNCILWCHICMWNIRIKYEKLKKIYWKMEKKTTEGMRTTTTATKLEKSLSSSGWCGECSTILYCGQNHI